MCLNACSSRLASAAKVPDFSSRDFFVPTPQRTHIILSAMINFIKFSGQCAPVVQKVHKKAEYLAQESESLISRACQAGDAVSTAPVRFFGCLPIHRAHLICFFFREKRKADESRVEDLSKDDETLNTELLARRDVQLTLLQEIETLKASRAALVQKKV